ncbi:MAG: tetratricopeptide repeat protein [Pseudomonadota bacterium]
MIRKLLVVAAALGLAGCAHNPLGSAEPPGVDAPRMVNVSQARDPESALIFSILAAEIALRSGENAEASRYYGAASLLTGDPAIAERATRIALFADDRPQALRSAERWLQLDPERMEAVQIATVLHMDAGEAQPAAAQMERVITRLQAEGTDPYPVLGSLVGQVDNRDGALAALRELAERRPDDAGVQRVWVEASLRFDSADAALLVAAEAAERFPDSLPLRLLHARALDAAERTGEALDLLQATAEAHPDSREARLAYARALVEEGDRETVRRELDRMLERSPDDEQLLLAVALLSLEAEQLGPARDYLERLDALGTRTDEVAYYLGRLHELEGDPAGARAAYQRVGGDEHQADAELRLARLTLEQEGPEAARAAFERLQQGADDERARRAYIVEANALRATGRYAEARARLNRGLIQFPGDTGLLYLRGLVHEREENIDRAETDFRAILEHDPDNVAALNALGYTLADRTDRYEEALELIKQAYAQEPNDAAIIDSYGWVLYRLGRLEEAEAHLRRAYGLMEDGEIASNLAVVLWERGAREEARAILESALEREPRHERLLRVRDDLFE